LRFILPLFLFVAVSAYANAPAEKKEEKKEEKPLVKEEEDHTGEGLPSGEVVASHRDISLPKSLVAKIEKLYLKAYRKVEPYSTKTDSQLILNIPRKLFLVKVVVKARTEGVLKHDTLFTTPKGGGVIDLKEVLTNKKGTFFTKFANLYKVENDKGYVPELSAFFVSKHKKRLIDGKMAGLGCDKYVDITSYFTKENAGDGIKVNTTDGRHVTVLGGTFVFVAPEPEALHVAVVEFEDSKRPDLMCGKL